VYTVAQHSEANCNDFGLLGYSLDKFKLMFITHEQTTEAFLQRKYSHMCCWIIKSLLYERSKPFSFSCHDGDFLVMRFHCTMLHSLPKFDTTQQHLSPGRYDAKQVINLGK